MSEMRVGIGFDIHRLVAGREFWLAGVAVDSATGALGHSDADVVMHAICDAMLGAAGLGNIGGHFPDTDSAYKGVRSGELVSSVRRLIERNGWQVVNLDVNILLEKPMIGGYLKRMTEVVAGLLGVDPDRVNLKPRTCEGMGEIGRGEAVGAQAVILLER
jgi:2-C-methyl-D-erythritol 2,4-cyclodiphosphate synthase